MFFFYLSQKELTDRIPAVHDGKIVLTVAVGLVDIIPYGCIYTNDAAAAEVLTVAVGLVGIILYGCIYTSDAAAAEVLMLSGVAI